VAERAQDRHIVEFFAAEAVVADVVTLQPFLAPAASASLVAQERALAHDQPVRGVRVLSAGPPVEDVNADVSHGHIE